jgi:hypothetical protein
LSDNRVRKLFLIVSILSLAVFCFIAYGEILAYYFTSIDAFPLLLTGKIDSPKDIIRIFSTPLGGGFPFGIYYRPLSELSYGIDYLIWGKNPMGYHLTNILLHLANSFMVFIVAYIIFKDREKGLLYAWVSSVLFLLSPLNAFLVPAISDRQDMLTALLIGLSLLSFAKMGKTKENGMFWYILSLLFGFLAVFSKENAFVLPFLVGFLSFIFDERSGYKEKTLKAIKYAVPFAGFVLLNTSLHIYLFGFWGVKISSGIYQHIYAAARSFFSLVGPMELLHLNKFSEVIVFLTVSLIGSLSLIIFIFMFGIRGIADILLSKELRLYTYLVFFILTFMIMFTIVGKASHPNNYYSNMAFTILIVMVLVDTFKRRGLSILIKSLGIGFVLYTMVYSTIFTRYNAWQNSSEITRQTIEETEAALNSDRSVSRIYLINWPGFIGLDASPPGRSATILVGYSMDAWAEWAGIKSHREIEFIPVSYTLFPPDNIRAKFNYIFLDNRKIDVEVEGCLISPPKFPYAGDIPFEFRIYSGQMKAELIFNRELEADERIFLYDIKGIRVISNEDFTYTAL